MNVVAMPNFMLIISLLCAAVGLIWLLIGVFGMAWLPNRLQQYLLNNTIIKIIRAHVTLKVLLPMLFILVLIGVSGVAFVGELIKNDLREQLLKRAILAAHTLQAATESASTTGGIQRYVASMGIEEDVEFAIVVAGVPPRVIAATELALINQSLQQLPSKDFADDLRQVLQERKLEYHFGQGADQSLLDVSAPVSIFNITENNAPLGEGALMIHISTVNMQNAGNYRILELAIGLLGMLVSLMLILLWVIRQQVLLPQRAILAVVQERQRGHKAFVTVSGSDEFAQLGKAFNDMVATADEVVKQKNQFVSIVSHELRTPLTSIKGSLSLIRGVFSSNLPAQASELLDTAIRNSDRLGILINDLLDMEKINAGRLEISPARIDLVPLIHKSLKDNEQYAKQHQVTLRATQLPATAIVHADEYRIIQVLANLLSNAAKYSHPDSTVDVAVTPLPNAFRISVKDYGRGIPESFRPKMFQAFVQADSSDTREKGGTGLGLRITQALLKAHGSQLDYHSVEGVGTEFFFTLPKSDVQDS